MGYESNEASVFTNVSATTSTSQGIHTLPELAEVKATVCRVTKPGGLVVLNADDPLVAGVARRVRGARGLLLDGPRFLAAPRAPPTGGRARLGPDGGRLVEWDGADAHALLDVADLPVALGGLARHNVANALAAAGGARAMGATREEVAAGLRGFRPSAELSPGRLNLFRLGRRTVIVDFAHNEAGTEAILDVAGRSPAGRRAGGAGRRGHRHRRRPSRRHLPRAISQDHSPAMAERVAVKETLAYLRGRAREEIIGGPRSRASPRAASNPTTVPVYETGGRGPGVRAGRNGPRPPRPPRSPDPAEPAGTRTHRGSSCCSATRTATRCSSCSRASGRMGSTSPRRCGISHRGSLTGIARVRRSR